MPESSRTPVAAGLFSEALTVCVVAHTHWDREWYHSAPAFRQRLVALVDSLLANATGATAPFLLDGQAVVLEDYLSVRPERAQLLAQWLRTGALEAGPWYVLADGLIPSGEAIVRNLMTGRRVLQQLDAGITAPSVGYCPDTFGHPAALPLIAEGFGFGLTVVWRGYGGARAPAGDTVCWQHASGKEVLLYHLPPDGYETGSALPTDPDDATVRWNALRGLLHNRSRLGVVLVPNGADHHALQPNLTDALKSLQKAAGSDVVVRESLSGFAKRIQGAASTRMHELPVVVGELRDSYGYTWTLGGTYGTRAAQKRANAHAERALLRDVEPWLVLAWLHDAPNAHEVAADSTITLAQVPALLDAAWRTLLRAHPHDTLCGCSIDAVARSMDEAMSSTIAQSRGLRNAALSLSMRHDIVAARSRGLSVQPSIVVRNRVARWRGGIAELVLDETLGDVLVGPSSAIVSDNVGEDSISTVESSAALALKDLGATEKRVPTVSGHVIQLLKSRLAYRRRESPQHYPDNDLVREHRALVWMPPVPPIGIAVRPLAFYSTGSDSTEAKSAGAESSHSDLIPGDSVTFRVPAKNETAANDVAFAAFVPSVLRAINDDLELNNGRLRARIGKNGVSIEQNGRVLHNVLTFETSQDVGDSYTPAIRGTPELLRIVRVERGDEGPLRSSAKLWLTTAEKKYSVRVVATMSLDADSETLRVGIRGHNQRRNHRLRVNFMTDVIQQNSEVNIWADAAFGPVLRNPLEVPAADQTQEMVPPTMPMHRWATLSSLSSGATLHADGLAEVEASASSGAISLTLLRAIGELSRNNLRERPGHAGWPAPIPLAQSLGAFRARIALQLHGAWSQKTRNDVEDASDAFLLPLTGGTARDLEHSNFEVVGPALVGEGLRQSAITLAADHDGIVLRCTNDSTDTRNGAWILPADQTFEYAMSRLDETLIEPWQPSNSRIEFSVGARSVVTIRVRRRVQ